MSSPPACAERSACLLSIPNLAQDIITTFNALLRIAQLEGDENPARPERTDLAPILTSIVELFESVAEDQGFALKMALPPEPLDVTGDRGLLTRLFSNIVENAIRQEEGACS